MPAHIDSHWVDIVPPLAPVSVADPLMIVAALAPLLGLLAIGVWLYRRPRYRNRRALQGLARSLRDSPGGTRSACFEIQRCLRSGLARQRLRAVSWSDARQADWRDYLDRLTRYCYAAEAPAASEVDGMIREARAWLARKVAES